MLFGINTLAEAAIAVGIVLLLVLERRMRSVKEQRSLIARLERVRQPHGY